MAVLILFLGNKEKLPEVNNLTKGSCEKVFIHDQQNMFVDATERVFA